MPTGRPDLRTVLARGFDAAGVVFYTNYQSAKGRQLAANPVAAALFSWLPLERQVRLRGPVAKVDPRRDRALLRVPAARGAAGGLGLAAVRAAGRTGRSWSGGWPRSPSASATPRSRRRRTGAATGSR